MEEHKYLQQLIDAGENAPQLTPKQAKILDAAIEIFAEKGYANTSTSEIAKKAGVAEGTIFRHYKTKKELLISIVTPVLTRFVVPVFATHFVKQVFDQEAGNYEDLLRKIIVNRFDFAKNNVPLIKIIMQEMAFHSEIQQAYQQVFSREVLPRFKEAVHHFQKEGQIIQYPSTTIIRFTMTTIIGFLITRFIVLPDAEWDDEEEINRTIDLLMHGITPR
ncbi:TetR/AcrR family transcriptional regulator [Alteribacillus sp. HJP-4]|uniref:TetR/AcrR family transcriptional regulator n=1 Tax=Alteribacillus sp. HJP-4 TaxID=2775394 RepID=UPI0035CCD2DE